ncbi:MAG: hypothetical protein PHR68_01495 [Candidatus Gracilibacteria bacterium]|nr:hypothetical protein [Candidatus Gracilibacteria bacterium]
MSFTKIKVLALLGIMSSFSYANASINFGNSYNSLEIKKLENLQKQLIKYLDKDFNSSIKEVSNTIDKTYFKTEYAYIKKDISEYYPFSKEETVSQFKSDISYYKKLKTSIEESVSGKKPFNITANEKTSVESDIVSIQKDFVKSLREYVNKYLKQDYTEEGDFDYSFSSEEFGSINMTSSKYKSIYSFLTNSQEFDLVLDTKFDLKSGLKGDLKGDFNFKIIDNTFYISLKDYDLSVDSSTSNSTEVKAIIEEKTKLLTEILEKYKGKNIKISNVNSESEMSKKMISDFVENKLESIFKVLESQSILTVYKKVGDSYLLKANTQTIYNIGKIIDSENAPTYKEFSKNLGKFNLGFVIISPIYFTKTDNSIKLTNELISAFGKGINTLEKVGEKYIFTSKYKTNSSYLKYSYDLYSSSDKVIFNLNSDYLTGNITWENNYLNSNFSSLGQIFTLKGDYSKDKLNLIGNLNSEQILTIKSNKLGTDYYDYDISLDLSKISKMKMNLKGKSKITFGNYEIKAPENSEELKSEDLNLDEILK